MSAREPIAIVGIGCSLPGSLSSAQALWEGLVRGVDGIETVPGDRWSLREFYSRDPQRAGMISSSRGGFLRGIDQFDNEFFNIFPKEAERIDPQQRLLLQTTFEALEDAGDRLEDISGSRTSVYMASFMADYWLVQADPSNRHDISPHVPMGLSLTGLSNRISYFYDLRGPSISLDTACSGSLAAVHLGCNSIWSDQADAALAGGVNVIINPESSLLMSKGGFLSPDGACKTFDARANGYVRSEGVGVVYLKPLSRAKRDGNAIYAVILGTACNSDGYTPKGLTVPSLEAQTRCLRDAHASAGISAREVSYVEAHGTGTPVGDPIETEAFSRVFAERADPLLIGSIKTNIGHLESVAGVAGLMKVALCLKEKKIPGNLHFDNPNPTIPFDAWKLKVVDSLTEWAPHREKSPRTAGINSFGAGGTNVHVVLREHDGAAEARPTPEENLYLYPLSAATAPALKALVKAHLEYLRTSPAHLRDICFSLGRRRSKLKHQLYIVGSDRADVAAKLDAYLAGTLKPGVTQHQQKRRRKTAFIFSGQGPQWYAMGRQLMEREPSFRASIERIDGLLRKLANWSLVEEMSRDEATSKVDDTRIAQPAIMAIQIALVELWKRHGIEPDAVMGHSIGEVAAAWCAGALTLEEAVEVIYQRSRVQYEATGKGRMLAVGCNLEEARKLIEHCQDRVSIAAVNGPDSLTLAGDAEPLVEIANTLEAREVFCKFLVVNVPFHSHHMEPLKDELVRSLAGLQPRANTVSFYSSVTGDAADGRTLTSAYWFRNVREPVYFVQAMDALVRDGFDLFVEVGAHPVLSRDMKTLFEARGASASVHPSLRRKDNEKLVFLSTLGALAAEGEQIDWERVYEGANRVRDLPRYPWDKKSLWQESSQHRTNRLVSRVHPLLSENVSSMLAGVASHRVDLDKRRIPFVEDHKVEGVVIFPGTGHLEVATAVGWTLHGKGHVALEDVRFENALFVADDANDQEIRLEVYSDQGDYWLMSRDPRKPESGWQKHSTGRLCAWRSGALRDEDPWPYRRRSVPPPRGLSRPPPPVRIEFRDDGVSIEELKRRIDNALSLADFYRELGHGGLHYGRTFRGVKGIWHAGKEVLAEIQVHESLLEDLDRYGFHPAVLDACLQTIFGAKLALGESGHGVYLPVEIKRCVFHGQLPAGSVFCHAKVTENTRQYLGGDLRIYDASGTLLVEILGLKTKHLKGSSHLAEVDPQYDATYEATWEPLALTKPAEAGGAAPKRRAAILGDDPDVTNFLSEVLAVHGSVVPQLHDPEALQPEELSDLVVTYPLEARAVRDATDAADVEAIVRTTVGRTVAALQKLQRRDFEGTVWFLTRTVETVLAADEVDLSQSVWSGMARVFANEHPRARVKIVDLQKLSATSCEVFARAFASAVLDDATEVALRDGAIFVKRLAPLARELAEQRYAAEMDGCGGNYEAFVRHPGSLDTVAFREKTTRPLLPNEVEVEVHAAGLNFKDVMNGMGLLTKEAVAGGLMADQLGLEFAGVVTRIGTDVKSHGVGEEVFGLGPNSFGGRAIVPEHTVIRKPKHLSFQDAAALPIVYLTAHYALVSLARVRKGEKVLIHAGAGGVGIAAIRLAKLLGAEVFATVSSEDKREYLRSLGVTNLYYSRSLDFFDGVMRDSRGGVDVVLNSLSGRFISQSIKCLRPFGRFIEIGKVDIYNDSSLHLKRFGDNLSYFAVDVDRLLSQRPEESREVLSEVLKLFDEVKLEPHPVTAFPINDLGRALTSLATARLIGKAVVNMETESKVSVIRNGRLALSPERSYVITGGASGLGLVLAQLFADRGARHLVLVSRGGPKNEDDRARIDALKAQGVEVSLPFVDVGNQADVDRLFGDLDAAGAVVGGVVHSAAVLEDVTVANLTTDSFVHVFRPKAIGAWNLHRATKGMPLEFFLMISSLSSVVGIPGQTAYSASNGFLDRLVGLRTSAGLPAQSVQLGVLDTFAGMTARNTHLISKLASQGWNAMSAEETRSKIERVLLDRGSVRLCANIDWPRVKQFSSHLQRDSFYREVMAEAGAAGPHAGGDALAAKILSLPEVDGRRHLCTELAHALAQSLGADPAAVPLDVSVVDLGLDSLMLTQLRNWIAQKLEINVPLMRMAKGPSLQQLSADLVAELRVKAEPQSATRAESETEAGFKRLGEWFVCVKEPEPSKKRMLVLFHAMGTGASMFMGLLNQPPAGFEVVSVQMPGREERASEPCLSDVESFYPLEEPLSRLLEGAECRFYGHSFGGILAYEMAKRMRQRGIRISHLFVSSSLPPTLTESWRSDSADNPFGLTSAAYDKLMGSIATGMSGPERERVMALLLRDMTFLSTYRHRPTGGLDVPITAIVGDADPVVSIQEMERWSELTSRRFQQHVFPGDHWFVTKNRFQLVKLIEAQSALDGE